MNLKNILFEIKDRVAYVTINRPEVRNALDLQTVNELHEVIGEINRSEECGVAILTGSGDKVFVSGADIRDLKARTKLDALKGINSRLMKALEECDKPVIAAVNGFALGGGFELALACDIRVCSDRAKFGLPEVSLGILPGAGGIYRVSRVAGIGVAKELILTGNIIEPERALSLGLVSRVVPADQLMDAAREVAEKILSRGPLAVRLAKRAINLTTQMSTDAAMALDEYAQGILFESEDKLEGMSAFLEKRPAKFKGR